MSTTARRARYAWYETNQLLPADRPVHNWYRFVLSYPPHLVRTYLNRFGVTADQQVLDPFCGTGTTVVECKKQGISSLGIEANAIAHFAARVKTDWTPCPDSLMRHARQVAAAALADLERSGIDDNDAYPLCLGNLDQDQGLRDLPPEQKALLLTDSISPRPLHKTLVLTHYLNTFRDERYYDHERLALAKALVTVIGNLHFGPEVGVGAIKADAAVIGPWLANIDAIAEDLRVLRPQEVAPVTMYHADARQAAHMVLPSSVDAVITSPPYPNEKDYTRTTRLESVLLGFLHNKTELQTLKRGLMRSNTRGVYKGDDDDVWISQFPKIEYLAQMIEARRIALGKTSGFERLYAKVTKLYFGGMARHLADLRTILRPGAHLAYVVGDQASYLQVMIRTGQLLGEIAQSLGYELVGIDLFRTRQATATREQLREEVVILRWPG